MTELAVLIITGGIVIASATFLILWVLEVVEGEIIKTTAIVVLWTMLQVTAVTMVIEAFKLSF